MLVTSAVSTKCIFKSYDEHTLFSRVIIVYLVSFVYGLPSNMHAHFLLVDSVVLVHLVLYLFIKYKNVSLYIHKHNKCVVHYIL